MECVAQVGILPAHLGSALRQLGVHESPRKGDCASRGPRRQDQLRRPDLPRDDGGVHEDPRADDSTHDDHGGVESPEPSRECLSFARRGHPRIGSTRKYAASVRITMKTTSTRRPARAISATVSLPVENAMAFGGVPTGSMKPLLAASPAATRSTSGLIPEATASEDATGRNAAAVAVLLVNSVRMVMIVVTIRTRASGGSARRFPTDAVIHAASPPSWIAAASDSPPPKRMSTPHGMRSASSHVIARVPLASSGIRSSASAHMTLIPASLIAGHARASNG